jgi:ADP-ribose pyrophosphatase YjhB (NUDIX family)
MPQFWLETAKKLQAISKTGLHFSENPYDRERYEQIAELGNELIAHYSLHTPVEIERFFANNEGYVTPKVDVRALVVKNDEILMVQEKADGKWTIPGGWADVGYTPYEIAVKETFEEAGLNVKPIRLLAVMDKKCHPHPPSPFYSYKVFILCEIIGGTVHPGIETLDARFFNCNNLPELSVDRLTQNQLDIIIERYKNSGLPAYCE